MGSETKKFGKAKSLAKSFKRLSVIVKTMSPTPKDDPKLLATWKELDKSLQAGGMSIYIARKEIASRYQTSVSTVYRWLNKDAKALLSSLTGDSYRLYLP